MILFTQHPPASVPARPHHPHREASPQGPGRGPGARLPGRLGRQQGLRRGRLTIQKAVFILTID